MNFIEPKIHFELRTIWKSAWSNLVVDFGSLHFNEQFQRKTKLCAQTS